MRLLVLVASLLGFAFVAGAAGGAHVVLADIRAQDAASPVLRQWDQALMLGLAHTLAALACAAIPPASRLKLAAGWTFVAGAGLFSGVQLVRIAGIGVPGMLVPIGGVCLMAAWLLLAASAALAKRN